MDPRIEALKYERSNSDVWGNDVHVDDFSFLIGNEIGELEYCAFFDDVVHNRFLL